MKAVVLVALAILVVTDAVIGVWAGLFPRSFYDDFPGLGRVWVAVDGPYNEHLVRDVGSLYLGLAVIGLVALISRRALLVSAFGLGSLVFGLPHLTYHLRHTDVLGTTDNFLSVGGLAVAVVCAAICAATGLRPGLLDGHRDGARPADG